MPRKAKSTKVVLQLVSSAHPSWRVYHGTLKRGRGRPQKTVALFQVFGEKLPYECIDEVKKHLLAAGLPSNGVYVAHDSMGYARYIGRGNIFQRLKARKKAQRLELSYFSFYVVLEKTHEREIESLLIRAAGPLLEFNDRNRRDNIQAGDVRDFEAGTQFYERQYKRGRQARRRRGRPPRPKLTGV